MVRVDVNTKRGEELNQLSRLLFDAAAIKWYWSVGLDLSAGAITVLLSFADTMSDAKKLWGALIVMIILIVAYILRQLFESQYDLAETMRRQSVLTEGIGFPIKDWLFSEWRRRSGKRILKRFTLRKRNEDYYQSKEAPGPRRLLEMTQESAFWTRYLYDRLLKIAIMFCIIATLLFAAVILALLTGSVPRSIGPTIAYGIFLTVPIIITLNIVGWAITLRRLIQGLCEIEKDMEELSNLKRLDQESVLRLVFEYNCLVAVGFPIPQAIFKYEYDNIKSEWEHTHA